MNRIHQIVATVLSLGAGAAHAQSGVLLTPLTGGGQAQGLFFDLTALHQGGVWVDSVELHLNAPPGPFTGEIWVRDGSYLGHTSDAEGWVHHGTGIGSAGPFSLSYLYLCTQTPIEVPAGRTVGVFVTSTVSQEYTPIPPAMSIYATPDLELRGGTAKFGGQFSDPDVTNAMIGIRLLYETSSFCYANCDRSTGTPFLNVVDFSCFLNHWAASTNYANCDCSTTFPRLNVLDFQCFLNKFAAGCSAP